MAVYIFNLFLMERTENKNKYANTGVKIQFIVDKLNLDSSNNSKIA